MLADVTQLPATFGNPPSLRTDAARLIMKWCRTAGSGNTYQGRWLSLDPPSYYRPSRPISR